MTDPNPVRRTIIVAVSDLSGVLRGKAMAANEVEGAEDGFLALTDQIFAADPTDEPIPGLAHGTTRGAPNALVRPDLDTLRSVPWIPGWSICLATAYHSPDATLSVSPRAVLQQVLERARGRGVHVRAGFEYEFRLTRAGKPAGHGSGISYSIHEIAGLHEFVDELVASCDAMGLDIGTIHTEGGRGPIEANLAPANGLAAADDAALFKWTVAQVAAQLGLRSSFLAKTNPDEEGSSGHLHVSATTSDGQALFRRDDAHDTGLATHSSGAVAGLLDHMAAASLLYNPTINSYKRLVPGYFAPVNATWGFDNRTAAVRVLPSGQGALRLENRRPGADANPYLVLAATIASMLLGSDANRPIPRPVTGDASTSTEQQELPATLESAIGAFAADDPLRQALGKEFSDHFEATRRWELARWQRAVTSWERRRYRHVT
ncbi:glutamine synthetase [soil metagenome]